MCFCLYRGFESDQNLIGLLWVSSARMDVDRISHVLHRSQPFHLRDVDTLLTAYATRCNVSVKDAFELNYFAVADNSKLHFCTLCAKVTSLSLDHRDIDRNRLRNWL